MATATRNPSARCRPSRPPSSLSPSLRSRPSTRAAAAWPARSVTAPIPSTSRWRWGSSRSCPPCARPNPIPSSSPTAPPAATRSATVPAARRDTLPACWPWGCRTRPDRMGQGRGDTIMPLPLFPTSLVGSYAQPDWLIDRQKLAGRFPPRVRARELWRVAPEHLEQAQDDATLLAIHDQERAGLDIITDGEVRRESYSNRFATALEGVDIDNPGTALDRSGHPNPVPRVVGKVRRKHAVAVRDVQFLRASTTRMIKVTLPGPFTMSQQVQNDFYKDEEEMALDYAAAVNAEMKDLFAAGADIVQIDEPYMQARPEKARQYGLKALNQALSGATGRTAVHICFGYAAIIHVRPSAYSFLPELATSPVQQISIETAQSKLDCAILERLPLKTIILGVLDLSDMTVETPETVAQRIRRALVYVPIERVVVAPDCGMKYLPREVAFGKMCAMVEGARIVRAELGA